MMTVRDENSDKVVVLQVTGEVTDADYKDVLIPELEKVQEAHGEMRAVLYFDENFSGYTMGAMVDDAVFGMKNISSFKKVSIIGLHGWMEAFVSFANTIAPNIVKEFKPDEMDQALEWANS